MHGHSQDLRGWLVKYICSVHKHAQISGSGSMLLQQNFENTTSDTVSGGF